MCRTRRNEDAVDEDVDHEPAKAATCKTELTVPNHYGKHIFVPSFSDCLMVIAYQSKHWQFKAEAMHECNFQNLTSGIALLFHLKPQINIDLWLICICC